MAANRGTLTVKNLMNDLAEVTNWDTFGIALGIKTHKLTEIRMNKFGELQGCKIAMFDLWLRSDVNASWEKVVKALDESDNETIGLVIREKYLSFGRGSSKSKTVIVTGKGGATSGGGRSVKPASQIPYSVSVSQSHVMEVDVPTASVQGQMVFQNEDGTDGGEEEDKMTKMIEFLTSGQVDVNYVDPDDDHKQSLLHQIVQGGDIGTLKVLIAFGANVNFINGFGCTPLDTAMMLNQREAVKILKEVGGKMRREFGASYPPDNQTQAHQIVGAATNNVLVLDNSCSMALVQLELMNQIELATDSKITDLFQWIVAGGVSGLLMMFMVYGKKSIGDLRRLYFQLRERVFSNNTGADKSQELERFVVEVLGDSVRMSEVTEPKLLIGAVYKKTTHLDLKFFNNCFKDDDSRTHAWKVARYTCSFPFILGECDNFVDMGVLCKNPTDLALAKIRQVSDIDGVVSLGDGILPAEDLGPVSLINFLDSDASLAHLSPEALSRIMSVITLYRSATDILGRQTAINHDAGNISGCRYFRFDPLLQDQIPASEDTSLDMLINVVFQTIAYVLKSDGTKLSHFLTFINNPT